MNVEKEFQCEICGETFEKGRTDEEAMEESKQVFGEVPEQELGMICEDCFIQLGFTGNVH